ncbi:MAG: hypothetical protein WA978_17060 [Sphingopyxis granuli]|uniref:hypothetical protein n=1 Tax=Sphingopyxis granuli TaxID=267128 RepID=UPI0010F7EB21
MTVKRPRSPTPPANDAAAAFDQLRSEVSLLHAAIEGLIAAKEKLPDYAPTLRKIEARLDRIDQWHAHIADKPAMLLTPEGLVTRLADAAIVVRAEDRKAIGDARDALSRELGRVEGMIKQRRSTAEQDWWVTWGATGGLLCGMFLSLVGVSLWI